MKTKEELIKQGENKFGDQKIELERLKLEVLIDIRDAFVDVRNSLKEIEFYLLSR